ncbi:MAG: hypothetical protein ACJ8EW_03245, partial [Rhizobium sp.]
TFETMMLVTSIEQKTIPRSQALELGLINGIIPYGDEPGYRLCGPDAKQSLRCPRKAEAGIAPAAASLN